MSEGGGGGQGGCEWRIEVIVEMEMQKKNIYRGWGCQVQPGMGSRDGGWQIGRGLVGINVGGRG